MAFGDDDIMALLSDMGEPVTLGVNSTKALIDTPDEVLLQSLGQSGVIGKSILLTLKTGSLPGLTVGAVVTVRSITYKVRQPLAADDGALTKVLCIGA